MMKRSIIVFSVMFVCIIGTTALNLAVPSTDRLENSKFRDLANAKGNGRSIEIELVGNHRDNGRSLGNGKDNGFLVA
jgi:hypothetical protein